MYLHQKRLFRPLDKKARLSLTNPHDAFVSVARFT